MSTRDRVLEAAAGRFGIRGVDAVSLDEIAAEVGVRKQTVLYWFPSKEELVDGVLEATAADLAVVIDAAVRAAPDEPLARIDAVVTRRVPPRRSAAGAARPGARAEPAAADPGDAPARPRRPVGRTARVTYLGAEMDAGRLRRGDPRLVAALAYGTVTGIATEPEALRAVGLDGRPGRPAPVARRAARLPARRPGAVAISA